MKEVFLVEDHDEVLRIWRKKDINGLDLVHLDAHIDFGFHPAKPIEKIIKTARNLKELKSNLEYTLSFLHYERDFAKQTNIGNYIYPAMEEGIVHNFYWVIPGGIKEFRESAKIIKNILKGFSKQEPARINRRPQIMGCKLKDGIISIELLNRRFTICILEKLPILRKKVLLDIDTDFLVIDSLFNADNTKCIGKRKPWIQPEDLIKILKQKIKNPKVLTIAYSVNGGYTPIKYKHLGDEIAYYFAPRDCKRSFEINSQAAHYFNLFSSTNKSKYYQKAIRLNPAYRAADNNYGPLYLSLRKFSQTQKEFSRILKVDPENPACNLGLGNLALQKKDFKNAKKYFSKAKNQPKSYNGKIRTQALFGLAQAEFSLKNSKRAKKLLIRYQVHEPLQPYSYYLLGLIFEKERKYLQATFFYKDAIRLGFGSIELMFRLLKISRYVKEKDAIIKYVIAKYKEFKKGFNRVKNASLKKGKNIKGIRNVEKKMEILERRLSHAKDKSFA